MSHRIFIIDDDELFADCIAQSVRRSVSQLSLEHYKNAIDAINALSAPLPSLIFLDILLPGPDGFTFLNELVSYPDTAKIPVIIVTSLDLPTQNLQDYGVVGILNKETMKPSDVEEYAKRYTH